MLGRQRAYEMPTLSEHSEDYDASVLPLRPSHLHVVRFTFRIAPFVFLHRVVTARVFADRHPTWLDSVLVYAFVSGGGIRLRGVCLSLLFSYRPMFR